MARNLLVGTALQTGLTFMAALAASPAHAQPAPNAHPIGGSVVAGAAAISHSASNTQINQSSPRAAINWQSFDVGSKQSVTFQQPSSGAVALNRVTGPDPSQIAGRINANGQVVLINQSGVNFYQGAQVNTAGLIVTTANMTDTSFMAGSTTFDQPGKPNARITNAGTITVRQAGLAALVAPQVANSGVITAKLGHVVLAGAKTATLDLYGDGLLSLDVTNQVTQAPVGPDGKPVTALVTNTGVIAADGGTVQLTARAADGIVQDLVEAGGKVRAATVGNQTGVVALNGVGGSIVVTGQLAAPGRAPGTRGGDIEVVSDGNVTVASGAKIYASGKAGGSVVAIGTTLARAKGGPSVTPTLVAANTVIQKGATITANATVKGNGGRVTVLSSGATRMDGLITAKGGKQGGDGGFVEVSGDKLGLTTGMIDVSAPVGQTGTILFDPRDLDIVNTGTNDNDVSFLPPAGVPVGSPDQNTDITVSGSALTKLSGDLLIEASRNLTVDAPLAFTNQTAGQSVSMLAGNNLTVNQPVSTAGASLTLSAAVETDGTTQFANFNAAGALTINADVGGSTTGAIVLSGGSGGESLIGIAIGANVTGTSIDLITASNGRVSQTAGALTATTLTGNVAGFVSLTQGGNAVASIANFTSNAGFTLTDASPLSVSGNLSAVSVTLTAPSIGISGTITGENSDGNGSVSLTATNGGIAETSTGAILTSNFDASTAGSGGDIRLGNSANRILESDGITATNGDVILVDGEDLTLIGPHSGNNLFFEVAVANHVGTLTLSDFAADTSDPAILTAPGRISLVADNYSIQHPNSDTIDSTITAGTVELAPFSNDLNVSLLGAAGLVVGSDLLSIIQTNGGTLEVGGFTDVPHGATTPAASAASISIDGAVDLTNLAGTLRLDTTGAITEPGFLIVTNLTGSAASVEIDNSNITNLGNFTTSGNLTVMSDTLTVDGSVSAGGATAPDPANTATISLTTFDGGLQIGAAGTPGILNAGTVALTANGGSITEPNGSIKTNSLAAQALNVSADPDVLLTSTSNAIAASTGITAQDGNVALVDDPTLLLTGLYSGNNLFFEVTAPGGSLALQDATLQSTLSGGRISLVADNIAATGTSAIIAPGGTLELAPFSSINESVAGSSSSGQLLIDATLLSIISGGENAPSTLVIGGFTDTPNNVPLAASASSVTIDGPVDLTNIASNLELLAKGSVTEPGGPVTVSNVFGKSGGTFSLQNKSNAFNESTGITATNGDIVLVDDPTLVLTGTFTGNNLFFQVANAGDTLQLGLLNSDLYLPATLKAAAGGRISLVADNYTVVPPPTTFASKQPPSSIIAPNGTLELAPPPATAGETTSALINAGLFPIVNVGTTGLNTLVVGGFTDVPNGGTSPKPSASSLTINAALDLNTLVRAQALDLQAVGGIAQSAPITNVGTLLGIAGSAALTNSSNTVGTLAAFSTGAGFALVDDQALLVAGPVVDTGAASTLALTTETGDMTLAGLVSAANIVNLMSAGAINQTGGTVMAGTLTGSAVAAATFNSANQIAALGNFGATAFVLNNARDLLLAGTLNAANIKIQATTSTISLGDGAAIITGGTVRPAGPPQASLEPGNGGLGALLQSASFTQIGSSTVLGQGGGPATLRVSTTGNDRFDPPLGLQATSTWLILDLANGTATGNVFVQALDVTYTTPGSTNLSGTIAGISGGPAAAAGNIQPRINNNYLFNGCVIAATVCTNVPPPPLVTTNPNVGLTATLGAIYPLLALPPAEVTSPPKLLIVALPMLQPQPPQLTDPDVVPPNITYLDY